MSASHRDPEYMRNARIVRNATNAAHTRGEAVPCIGCGRDVQPGQRFDVGHRIDAARGGTNSLDNLGPQHRGENRRAGGRLGAARRYGARRREEGLPAW